MCFLKNRDLRPGIFPGFLRYKSKRSHLPDVTKIPNFFYSAGEECINLVRSAHLCVLSRRQGMMECWKNGIMGWRPSGK
jgi:hypothetical protein